MPASTTRRLTTASKPPRTSFVHGYGPAGPYLFSASRCRRRRNSYKLLQNRPLFTATSRPPRGHTSSAGARDVVVCARVERMECARFVRAARRHISERSAYDLAKWTHVDSGGVERVCAPRLGGPVC